MDEHENRVALFSFLPTMCGMAFDENFVYPWVRMKFSKIEELRRLGETSHSFRLCLELGHARAGLPMQDPSISDEVRARRDAKHMNKNLKRAQAWRRALHQGEIKYLREIPLFLEGRTMAARRMAQARSKAATASPWLCGSAAASSPRHCRQQAPE